MNRTFSILMRAILVCICIVFCGSPAGIHAENASEAASIRAMSYEEKVKLWNSFSEEKKEAIRKKARGMSEKKFNQLKNNFNKVEKFAPDEQKRVHNNFMRMRKFQPKQRKRVKENFKRFQKLPQERKQFYRQQFRRRPNHDMKPPFHKNFREPGLNQPRDLRPREGQGPGEHKPGRQGPGQQGPRPMQRQFDNRGPGNFDRTGKPEGMRKDLPQNTRPGSRPGKFQPGMERKGPGQFRIQKQRDFNGQGKPGNDKGARMQEIRKFRENMMRAPQESQNKPPENPERWNRIREFRQRFNMPQENENRLLHFRDQEKDQSGRPLPPRQRIEEKRQMRQPDHEFYKRPDKPQQHDKSEFRKRPLYNQNRPDKPDRPNRPEKPARTDRPQRPAKQNFNPDMKNRPARHFKKN